MKSIDNNRLEITIEDNPDLIDRVLHRASFLLRGQISDSESDAWERGSQPSIRSIHSGFNYSVLPRNPTYDPEGKASIHLTPDQLELALVAYGCAVIDNKILAAPGQPRPGGELDIVAIDGLLKQIDSIKEAAQAQ